MESLVDILIGALLNPDVQAAVAGIIVLSLVQALANLTRGVEDMDSEAQKKHIRDARTKWNPLVLGIVHAVSQYAAWRAGNKVNLLPNKKKRRGK